MAYTSFFAGAQAKGSNATGNGTGSDGKSGYHSYFGSKVQQAPTPQAAAQDRAQQQLQQRASAIIQNGAGPTPTAKPQSLLGKVGSTVKEAGKSALTTGQKAANTVVAGTEGVVGLGQAGVQAATGNKKGAASTARATSQLVDQQLDKGFGGKGAYLNSKQASATGGGNKSLVKNFVKPTAQGVTDIAPYVVPLGAGKGASLVRKVVTSAGANAAVSAASTAANQTLNGTFDKKETIKAAIAGGILGAAIPAGGHALGKAGAETAAKTGLGSKTAAKTALTTAKQNTLLDAARKAPPIIKSEVNPDHVTQGLHDGVIKQTPVHEIALGAESAGKKVDSQKVAQYQKQIKDGEPIEPIVVHDVNGQKVVVDGQHRLAAAQKLGIDTVPTVEKPAGVMPKETAPVKESAPVSEKPVAAPKENPVAASETQPKTAAAETPTKPVAQSPDGAAPAKPETAPVVEPVKGEVSSKASVAPEAAPSETRTLKPSETAHMDPIGGYTHSEHAAKDYADMLRGIEQNAKGGEMVSDGAGGYKRTSEHSQFYRDHYAENGKAPTKAHYLEEAKRQLESGKAAYGASDDYKKLLERESKPVPRVAVSKPSVPVAEQGISKVAKRIAKDLKQKYGDLAGYDKINIKDQAAKAAKLISNREELEKVVSGEKPLPDGLRATALIAAVRHDAELAKDGEFLRKLASSPLASESSYSAQELRLARENAAGDPVEAIKNLKKTRENALERRSGKTVAKATSDEIKAIRAAKVSIPKETVSSFIDSLKC